MLRAQKAIAFIEVNDGSSLASMQVIADTPLKEGLTTGSAISVTGTLAPSPGGKQAVELKADTITLFGSAPADTYPLQKKRHSLEFLRSIAHLRPRTNMHGAVTRIRNRLAYASHTFFQERGYLYIHTPIITSSDCEGAGELFRLTTLDLNHLPKDDAGRVDDTLDFFGRAAYLTVSGQLNVEAYACAMSNVYTFGPTFRAENSHTARHLAEFWMIEPELAFATAADVRACAEAYVRYLAGDILETHESDLALFEQFVDPDCIARLEQMRDTPFATMTYTEAVERLIASDKSFEYDVKWGSDLQTEHERYLCEEVISGPLFVTDYPKEIKSFYMRDNDDGKTVAAFDLLVPRVGELIGGSAREERYDHLLPKIEAAGLDPEIYSWYLDLRRYGTVPHGGFGLGFERLIQCVTGVENIRDVIPFPRAPGSITY